MSKVGTYQVMEQYDEVHRGENGQVIKLLIGKEEREKQKPRLIKVKVSNMFLFWH
jgi:hypothetical protein